MKNPCIFILTKALLAVGAVFLLTFRLAAPFFDRLANMLSSFLSHELKEPGLSTGAASGMTDLLKELFAEGVIPGVSGVLAFAPTIAVLFFCLSLMSESRAMKDLALLADPFMKRLGLSGASLTPLIMGFGCAVPAITAAGSMKEKGAARAAVFLIPLMPCSAKLPVCLLLCSSLFPGKEIQIILLLFTVDIAVLMLMALLLRGFFASPRVSAPPCSSHASHAFGNAETRSFLFRRAACTALKSGFDFVKKAFTVILIASALIWLLENLDADLQMTSSPDESLLAHLGESISPFLEPLGFGDWRAAAALISGLPAKEAAASALSVLAGSNSGASAVSHIFTPLSGFSFLVFCTLYMPCLPSFTAMKKQTGDLPSVIFSSVLQLALAWTVSFTVYHAGSLLL